MIKTLHIRVKDKHSKALKALAFSVNQVWNYCNELGYKHLQRQGEFFSAYDLNAYTSGAAKELGLHSQTVQAVQEQYVQSRRQFKKAKLQWRVSNPKSAKYSLGWIPLKSSAITYKAGQLHISGLGPLSLWDSFGLANYQEYFKTASLCEDSRGRWFVNIVVELPTGVHTVSDKVIGIDLGSKTAATCSNGIILEAKFYQTLEEKLAVAQRANKRDRVKAICQKMKNQRKDAIHKFTTALVREYGAVFVGNLSSAWQAASGNGKSALDSGWGIIKTQVLYKCEHAGSWGEVISESYTTQTCSACGKLTGPKGVEELHIRKWQCPDCGASHDRDVNAAINIAANGLHGVEDRVTTARLKKDKAIAKSLERKTKRAVNKVKTATRVVASLPSTD